MERLREQVIGKGISFLNSRSPQNERFHDRKAMITSNVTFRGWVTTAFFCTLLLGAICPVTVTAQISSQPNKLRAVSQTAALKKAPSKTSTQRRTRSMVAQAATGAMPNSLPEAPLDGSLVKHKIQPVGFFGGCQNGCGPACDCDVSCGAEGVYMDPACGAEPGCGFEPGCGIGHAIEVLDPGCGTEQAWMDPTCGLEASCGFEPSCGMDHMSDCGCDACNGCDVDSIPVFLPLLRVNWCRFNFFAGVQGFKGPLNFASTDPTNPNVRSGSGSFGFYEGFNEGRSLKRLLGWDLAAQLGVRATQSNLSGSEFTDETRQQVFVTGGLFRRVDYGLQYGAVIDYMNTDWWYQADLVQIRGELSWKTSTCHVFGAQFMAGVDDDTSSTTVRDSTNALFSGSIAFEPTDQYRLFYRRLLNRSGDWSAFAGATDRDDGLLGANLNMPLTQKLLLNTSATFLIPREGNNSGGHQEESWNISMGLTYRPGGPKGCGRYCRPLFDVADNGTFLVDFK